MISTKQVSELLDTSKIHFQSNTEVRKPDFIVDYNRNMGGVNTLSRVIIRTTFKKNGGNKSYRKFGELLIEIGIYNAFAIFQNSHQTTQLKFRQELIRELLMYHLYDVPNLKARRVDLMYLNSNPVRLIGRHCISTRDQGKKHQRYRCVQPYLGYS